MRYMFNQQTMMVIVFRKDLKKNAYTIQTCMKQSGNAACISTKGMKYML